MRSHGRSFGTLAFFSLTSLLTLSPTGCLDRFAAENSGTVRDRAKAAVERSSDAVARANEASRRVMDVQGLIDDQLGARLDAVRRQAAVGVHHLPRLGQQPLDSKISQLWAFQEIWQRCQFDFNLAQVCINLFHASRFQISITR